MNLISGSVYFLHREVLIKYCELISSNLIGQLGAQSVSTEGVESSKHELVALGGTLVTAQQTQRPEGVGV